MGPEGGEGDALNGSVTCFFPFLPEGGREALQTTLPPRFEPEAPRGGVRFVCLMGMETGRTMVEEVESGRWIRSIEERSGS